jgi:carbon monoxide dehydrogenase subunit G
MASIQHEVSIAAPPEAVWNAARDVGALHTRLVPGFVVDTQLEEGARIVTFANGMVVREPLISVDDERRRIAWSAVGTEMSHYSASLQIFEQEGGTRAVWIADLLPDTMAPLVAGLMEQGLSAMKRAFER